MRQRAITYETMPGHAVYMYHAPTGEEFNLGPLLGGPPLKTDIWGRVYFDRLRFNFNTQNWITPYGRQSRHRWFQAGKGLSPKAAA